MMQIVMMTVTMTFYFSHQDGDGDMKEINGDHLKPTILLNQVWHWQGVSKVIMRVRGRGAWRGTTGGMSMMGESWVVVVMMIADIYISISMGTFGHRKYKSRGEDGNK